MTMACITKTVSIYKEIPRHAQINISLEFFSDKDYLPS